MNKKGQVAGLGTIILIAVGLIFALALFEPIINTQSELTDLQSVVDESEDLSATTCYTPNGSINESNSDCNITVDNWYPTGDWRASESQCYLSSVTVGNSTTDLTENTDYNLDTDAGVIQMLNTTTTANSSFGNTVLADYSYCGEGYNKDSSSRSVAGLISLFAALAILAFTLIGLRNSGWLNLR